MAPIAVHPVRGLASLVSLVVSGVLAAFILIVMVLAAVWFAAVVTAMLPATGLYIALAIIGFAIGSPPTLLMFTVTAWVVIPLGVASLLVKGDLSWVVRYTRWVLKTKVAALCRVLLVGGVIVPLDIASLMFGGLFATLEPLDWVVEVLDPVASVTERLFRTAIGKTAT